MQEPILLIFACPQSLDSLQPLAVAAHLRRFKPEIREVPFHLGMSLPVFQHLYFSQWKRLHE